jgi:polar amino acid transport system substrate-binding protein
LIFSEPEIAQPSKTITLTTAEETWIRGHPVIRLGVDPEFAPFEYITSEGLYIGIASEYIKILNQRLGLKMQVTKDLTWKEAVDKAKTKEIDVLPCVGLTQERKNFLIFSKPYINFHRAIITRTDNPFLTGLSDIENMKVAVQQNSSHEGYLRENTMIRPLLYETLQEALLAISNGQAQAFVGNIASSTYWIRKLNLTNLKVAAPVSQETQNLHFAVRDDWPELISILNKGLASISQEKENDIRKRWVNIEYKPGIARRVVWRYLLQIAGVALVILLVILIWNYRLKREIQKRIEIDKKLFEANKSLKKLDQLKSMFIASMSHELRTPLNSIIGFTGIILQGMTGPLNDKQQDHLTRVYNSAKHLLALITDVIDISKIEAGRIDVFPEDIILSEIVDEAVINIEPQLKAKNLELKISVPNDLQMHTDRKRLLQCIINYLSNAVKFTEVGSITISAKKCDEKIEILVTDTGIGISQQDQSKLFEAFERLDSHLRVKAGGTGLGLHQTRKLATEILDGEILVRSQEGKGSTFGLLVPINLARVDSQQEQSEEDHP